jgi:uncharacterized membrane protein
MSYSELHKRSGVTPKDSHQSNYSDTMINIGDDIEMCTIRKRDTSLSLFLKSLKFFSFVFIFGGLLSLLMETLTGINKIYIYFLIGLIVSLQATYYKFRVWIDPNYRPDCNCVEPESIIPSKQDMMDGIFNVLGHKKSAIMFNIPNTVFGILFYCFMIFINIGQIYQVDAITFFLTCVSCLGSLYLWYTMIYEVKSICVICSSIHAISFLTLINFLI